MLLILPCSLNWFLVTFIEQNLFGTFKKMQKCLHAGALIRLHCVLSPNFIFLCLFLKCRASGKLHS